MLEGKELIIATKQYAYEDRHKSWLHLVSTVIFFTLVCSTILISGNLFVKLFFSLIAGLTTVRLFVIYHDYMHKAILNKSKIANAYFTLFGLYILAPKSIWKRSHDYHHKHNSKLYTSSIGSFPIVTKEKYQSFSRKDRFYYLFSRNCCTILFGYLFIFFYGMCVQSLISNARRHWDSALSIVVHFSIITLLVFLVGWQNTVFLVLLPMFIACAMGSYLFYAQHNFPGVTFVDKDGWTYINAAMNSSSYMKMNPVMHWFTGNIGYHHVHHLNARIPFYKLPEVYEKMPELQQAKTTSLTL